MTCFHLECQNLLKNQIMSFFCTHVSYTYFQTKLKCSFVINKINLIVLINTTFLMKKIQDSNINSTKFGELSY
jgi:hypothetical protein